MRPQLNFARYVADECIWMGYGVVEELKKQRLMSTKDKVEYDEAMVSMLACMVLSTARA